MIQLTAELADEILQFIKSLESIDYITQHHLRTAEALYSRSNSALQHVQLGVNVVCASILQQSMIALLNVHLTLAAQTTAENRWRDTLGHLGQAIGFIRSCMSTEDAKPAVQKLQDLMRVVKVQSDCGICISRSCFAKLCM